jgi:hypothetical protein
MRPVFLSLDKPGVLLALSVMFGGAFSAINGHGILASFPVFYLCCVVSCCETAAFRVSGT